MTPTQAALSQYINASRLLSYRSDELRRELQRKAAMNKTTKYIALGGLAAGVVLLVVLAERRAK